ncbi:MAG: NAD+ synthase [Candidatus Sumerlaeia bacterium]|nr:NAD+ synthase [Candidatus Sumerlaeia bacterium]
MKVYLSQINTTVGAVEDNAAKVRSEMMRARQAGADLVIFPEMTLSGYPPKDLLEFPSFVDRNEAAIADLARSADGIAAVVGFVSRRTCGEGKGLHNSAAFLADRRIISVHHKTLLPTYDVFDEGRHFDPAPSVQPVTWRGVRWAISICEDCWNDRLYWRRRLYPVDPIEQLACAGMDVLINISASPFWMGKRRIKQEMYAEVARRYGVPLVQVNLVGGNDSLVFDGWSNVFAPDGRIVAQLADFREDAALVYLASCHGPIRPTAQSDEEQVYEALLLGIRDYLGKCGFRRAVIGLSGGIDSALTAALAAAALGSENVLGVSMPSRFSSQSSLDDARQLADNLGIAYRVVSIEPMYAAALASLPELAANDGPDLAAENLQARIRGMILMAISNKYGHLVLSTGNKSELATGYCTLYGDMVGGLAVLADVPKTLVYRLSNYINQRAGRELIPRSSIEKPPSAELRPNQKDTDSLPPYEVLDPIVAAYVEERLAPEAIVAQGMDRATVEAVVRRINQNEYKRLQAAPGIKVTSKAFGYGRRMPIAAQY